MPVSWDALIHLQIPSNSCSMSKTDSCCLKGTKPKMSARIKPPMSTLWALQQKTIFSLKGRMWFCSTGNCLSWLKDTWNLKLLPWLHFLQAWVWHVTDCLQLFTCKGVKKEKKKSHTFRREGTLPLCAHGLEIKSLPQEWVPWHLWVQPAF